MSALIIFGLLLGLMLTGMPISIALGLTVLTFLFTLTQVPIESVALKLFTGIEGFEIMAIPFFILAGNFLTHGGVARRMINFATSLIGHWHGGLGLAGIVACAMFALVCGSSVTLAPVTKPEASPTSRCASPSLVPFSSTEIIDLRSAERGERIAALFRRRQHRALAPSPCRCCCPEAAPAQP